MAVLQLPKRSWRDKVGAMENGTPQLVARDFRRSFRMGPRRIEVLRGISMEVRRSEAVFLVGASGAGKTTLLYTLAGLERPEGGTVDFEGQRLYTGSSQAQAQIRNTQMGFVFQSYFLLPELTALEDRKSTRLNSSHPSISYAVFCLKKKNSQTTLIAL